MSDFTQARDQFVSDLVSSASDAAVKNNKALIAQTGMGVFILGVLSSLVAVVIARKLKLKL